MPPDRLAEWEALQRRFEAAREVLEPRWEADPERSRRILEERARELARPVSPPSWGASVQLVSFALGKESYALETSYVQAVFRLRQLSPVPGGTQHIYGVTAWRGELLTILDLRRLLGLPASGLNDLSHVIVLGATRAEFGVLADAVAELVTLPLSSIRTPVEGVGVRREYIRGITEDATILLDAAKLIQHHR